MLQRRARRGAGGPPVANRGPRSVLVALRLVLVAPLLLVGACSEPAAPPDDLAATTTSTSATSAPAADHYADGIFTSDEGRLSVALPQAPRRVEQEETVRGTSLRTVVFDVAVSRDEAYQVSYVDLPPSLGALDPEQALEDAVIGAADRVQATIESRRAASVEGRPALDAELRAALRIFTRIALVDRRLYTLQQVGPPAPTETYRRLLESFRLR